MADDPLVAPDRDCCSGARGAPRTRRRPAVLEDGLERLQADAEYAATAAAISRLLAATANDDPDADQELVFDFNPVGLAATKLILLHTAEAQ